MDSSEEVDEEDELAAESMLSELEGLDQEMADLEQQEVELTEIPEDEALVTLDDEMSSDPMAEGEPEVLEEETFEDWGDAVEALEEESDSPPSVDTPAIAASTAAEVPAGMGSLDTVIEGMITRSVQKAVADAMPQIVERIVQELRQPRP